MFDAFRGFLESLSTGKDNSYSGSSNNNNKLIWSFAGDANNNSSQGLVEQTQIGGFTSVFVNRVDPLTGLHKGWEPNTVFKHNLLTNNGRDSFHNYLYTNQTSGSQGIAFIYISLAENSGAPVAGDTVVSGELSGSMTRTSGTAAHTGGTNTTTITKTFTCTDTQYSGIQKSGLHNNPTGTVLSHQNTFTPTALVSGDQLQITWTLTLG